ncbi:MAG: type II secretion system minor pseudopilin GspI [Gammaproteobacteria bacterium]|nr:type II secretion system minor pseudopilin GspI [Gammaproteobacteria bacterium]
MKIHRGFTLLEVLIALAVAAVGLAGVSKVAGSNIYNAQYLQNKTIAQWVAMNRLTELRVRKEFPPIGKTKGDMEMAGRKWYWQQESKTTPFAMAAIKQSLREVEISVYTSDDSKASAIVSISTFLAKPE